MHGTNAMQYSHIICIFIIHHKCVCVCVCVVIMNGINAQICVMIICNVFLYETHSRHSYTHTYIAHGSIRNKRIANVSTLSVVKGKEIRISLPLTVVQSRPYRPRHTKWQFSPTARTFRTVIPLPPGVNAYAVTVHECEWMTVNGSEILIYLPSLLTE